MFELKLPDLGEGIHEAEILAWHVAPGDLVEEDAPLVDVETDKAAVTIPSPRAGRVVSLTGEPGDTVLVGQVIAVIDESPREGEAPPERPRGEGGGGRAAAPAPAPTAAATVPAAELPRPPAAPATRRLARELGVDLRLVAPSGPGGRVTQDDVRSHLERAAAPAPSPQAAPAPRGAGPAPLGAASAIPYFEPEPMPEFERWGPVDRAPLRSVRRRIARKMVTSLVLVPHVIHMDEADVTELEALRRRQNEKAGGEPRVSLLALVVKAVVAGLRKAPMLNASLDPDRGEIVYKRYYNIGLAADTDRGLMVPVLKGADGKSALELAAEIRSLAERARAGTIDVSDLQGGTFTITNIGPLGGIALAPAINYPEVAILGMGRVQEKPVVRDGEIVVRSMLPLTLSFDHRVADGADAARFVSNVVGLLGETDRMVLEV